MRDYVQYIATIALIVAFLFPGGLYLFNTLRGIAVETSENRTLTPWPSWGGDIRNYTDEIDAHFSDQFGGRLTLIRLARDIKDDLGEDAPLVIRGQEPWLFLGQTAYRDEFEGIGTWPNERVDDWAKALTDAKAIFDDKNISFAITIAPDKARIYPEFLPQGWRKGQRRFKTEILRHPDLKTMSFDIEPALIERKSTGEFLYYARDTHWNGSGGAVAINAILTQLDPTLTLPRPPETEPILTAGDRLYDLEGMLGAAETSEPALLRRAFPSQSGYKVTKPHLLADGTPERGATHTITVSAGPLPDDPKTLVIVGDSFADTMMPYIAWPYDQVVRIHHGANERVIGTDEVLSYNPDAVLFMIVERSAHRKQIPIRIGPTQDKSGNLLPLP